MRFEMKMPDLATNESQIRIIRWLVEAGQPVRRGQAVAEVETDKATVEVESSVNGVLEQIVAAPEQMVDVGQIIAIIEVKKPSE